MARKPAQSALFADESDKKGNGYGPVYAGVCRTIRHLTTAHGPEHPAAVDAEVWAGTIAQARSLAASIDRVDGRPGTAQANGVPLGMMHQQLDALMARLNPDATDAADPMTSLLEELKRQEQQQRDAALEARGGTT